MSDAPRMDHPDVAAGEQAKLRESGVAVQLSERLAALRDHIVAAFDELEVTGFRGELTLRARPERLLDLLRFCKEDPDVRCEVLADLSCVHWPGGEVSVNAQETTGWPTYTEKREGRMDVLYILYSVTHNHRFRILVSLSDDDPHIPSAHPVYGAAAWMECEAYDFFGVRFEDHPDLRRLHMPEEWEGHPLRKDYPLGGVETQYKGATVPPPNERSY